MNTCLSVIPGDGCGKEVIREAVKILDILCEKCDLEYEIFDAGAEYYLKTGKVWEHDTFQRVQESDAILFGAVGRADVKKPDGSSPASEVIFGLRNRLDLYANVRPIRLYEGIQHNISGKWKQVWQPEDVDLIIIRELTEGLYVRIGGEVRDGELAIDNRIITEKGSRRAIEFAADHAMKRKKSITCVDKSNVLKGDVLFRNVFDQVLDRPIYRELEKNGYYVDAFSMFLMSCPEKFDVVVTPNLFGDILSDLGSIMAGGIGMAPSGSYGEDHAMFEPVHGSAPDIAGKGMVNPSAALLSLSMLLEYLSEKKHDLRFQKAGEELKLSILEIITSGIRTPDLGGHAATKDFGDAVKGGFEDRVRTW